MVEVIGLDLLIVTFGTGGGLGRGVEIVVALGTCISRLAVLPVVEKHGASRAFEEKTMCF